MFWDETAPTLTWAYIFYLVVHISKAGSTPPSGSYTRVHTQHAIWLELPSPSFPACGQVSPPTFSHRHTLAVSLFQPRRARWRGLHGLGRTVGGRLGWFSRSAVFAFEEFDDCSSSHPALFPIRSRGLGHCQPHCPSSRASGY